MLSNDNRIEKIRGFYAYFTPSGGDALNQLALYQDRTVVIFDDKVSYLTETGSEPNVTATETALTGATVDETGRTARVEQQSGNLYFTSNDGVLRLESYDSKVFAAGMAPGQDLRALLDSVNGPILAGRTVNYRAVFGRRDANDNLMLGAPSDIVQITNEENASYTSSGAGPYTVTVTTSTYHFLTSGDIVIITDATDSDADAPTGASVTVVNNTTFTYSVPNDPSTGTLNWSISRNVRLEVSIPDDLTVETSPYFVQIYRGSQVTTGVAPNDFRLLVERELSASDIAAGVVFYEDNVDDVLIQDQPELYTNNNSREGEAQANFRPPLCDDVVLYKGMMIYGNSTSRHTLSLSLVAPANLASGDYIEVTLGTTQRYVARTGVGNENTLAESATFVGTTITVNSNTHGLVTGDTILISNAIGTGTLPDGEYTITAHSANAFDFVAAATPTTLVTLSFQGLTDGTYPIFTLDNASASIATQLSRTARGLVKAINRTDASTITASYLSAVSGTPGRMLFRAKSFGNPFSVIANTTTAGEGFFPVLPTSGTSVESSNDANPHHFFVSKLQEPEAVPLLNFYAVGSRNKAILRVVALRDSLIVIKEDGVFRVTGDTPAGLAVTTLDGTVFCIAADSVQVINNEIYMLSNQGVCRISESSVQILSRVIEDVISPIVGQESISDVTGAVGYESDRTYRISTTEPNQSGTTTTYVFNVLNNAWTSSDIALFKQGIVGLKDTLFLISTDNAILRERKQQTRIDYTAQNFSLTVVSVAADKLSATVLMPTGTPAPGDVILKNSLFSRISSVEVSGANYIFTFTKETNIEAADVLDLYKGYTAEVTFAPFHGGFVGRWKQFSQLQIHTRTANISQLTITFFGNNFAGSASTLWQDSTVTGTSIGWGREPWGFFEWGQGDGLNIVQTTVAAPVIRLLVPRFQARATYLKPKLTHQEAGESIDIQALSYSLRAYKERVSK